MHKVTVLMSTYNGEKYLREQLDSILSQTIVELKLMIRDDGSTDSTLEILDEYKSRYSSIQVFEGENVGYVKSFMWLVDKVGTEEGMFYAFADQDDYWDSNKLCKAIEMIESETNIEQPILYYSNLDVVDENLNYIRKGNVWEGSIDKFMFLMFIGIRGCTIVYNSYLQSILCSQKPEYVSSHDGFIALLAFWSGKVIYDDNAYIKYRQTGNNTSITGTSKLDALKKNVSYFKKRMGVKAHEREFNAKSILNAYGKYINEKELVEKVAFYKDSFSTKRRLMKDKRYFKFHTSINVANKLLIIFGKL